MPKTKSNPPSPVSTDLAFWSTRVRGKVVRYAGWRPGRFKHDDIVRRLWFVLTNSHKGPSKK